MNNVYLTIFLITIALGGIGFLILTKTTANPPILIEPSISIQTPTPVYQATPTLTPSPIPVSSIGEIPNLPDIKFKYYGGSSNLYNERVKLIVSATVNNSESLPQKIILDGNTVTINKWEIYQAERGFGVYAYIEMGGKEGKIGFWYSERGVSSPTYGGILSFVVRKWTDPPTEEEKKRGITGTYHEEDINLIGIDYSLSTSDWSFVQLAKSLYSEKLLRFEPS